MKKKLIILSVTSLTLVGLLGFASGNGKSLSIFAGSSCDGGHDGYHYKANAADYGKTGNKEFWACCTCQSQFLEPPTGTFKVREFSEAEFGGGEFNANHPAFIPALEARTATQTRDNYTVSSENVREVLFKDATAYTIGDSTVEMIWDDGKLYAYVTMGENTTSISVTSDYLQEATTITTSSKVLLGESAELVNAKEVNTTFVATYNGNEITYGGKVVLNSNANNLDPARKLFKAKALNDNETITIDGQKDTYYDDAYEIDISYVSLDDWNNNDVQATGKAYAVWDNNYLYVFVKVSDPNIDDHTLAGSKFGDPGTEQVDGVELWLSTCQDLPTSSSSWGREGYQELMLRRRAGSPGCTYYSRHSMGAKLWEDGNPHNQFTNTIPGLEGKENYTSSVSAVNDAEHYYTSEFRVPWYTFGERYVEIDDKANEIIDIMININDGELASGFVIDQNANEVKYLNMPRKGIVSTNSKGCDVWCTGSLQYMDQLQLIK